jgi:hypothetical protein
MNPSGKRRRVSRLQHVLPQSVLRHALSFLSLADVCSMRTVNVFQSRFPQWTIMELSQDDLLRLNMPLPRALHLFATQTQRLTCSSFDWECYTGVVLWSTVLQSFRQLRQLSLQLSLQLRLDDRRRTLDTRDAKDLIRITQGCPSLVRLHIEQWRESLDADTLAPALKASHLQSLCLDNVTADLRDPNHVKTLFTSLPATLTELRLTNTFVVLTGELLQLLLTTCPELTRVQMYVLNTDGTLHADDWKWLYTPSPRVWQEWTLRACGPREEVRPWLGSAVLMHFARAKIQHKLSLSFMADETIEPWTSSLWRSFLAETGHPTSPLQVLDFGRLMFDQQDDLGGTLMECFPNLHTAAPRSTCLPIAAQALLRAYKRKWPLVIGQHDFPPQRPQWLLHGDVDSVVDHWTQHMPRDHFHELSISRRTYHRHHLLPNLSLVIPSQDHWQTIDIDLSETDVTLCDDVMRHITRLSTLRALEVRAHRITVSNPALTQFLEHATFERCSLYATNSHSDIHLPADLLLSLWNDKPSARQIIHLQHGVVTNVSNADWNDLARRWHTSRALTFSCIVPNDVHPDEFSVAATKQKRTWLEKRVRIHTAPPHDFTMIIDITGPR